MVSAACGALDWSCQVNALDGRVDTAAGEVTTLAETTLPAIGAGVVEAGGAVVATAGEVGDFAADVGQVIAQFNATLEAVSGETLALTDNLIERIEAEREALDYFLLENAARYAAFTGGPGGCGPQCVAFRDGIPGVHGGFLGLLDRYETTVNLAGRALAALAMDGNGTYPVIPLDLAPLRDGLVRVPGFALYPIYEALAAVRPGAGDPVCGDDGACRNLRFLDQAFARVEGALGELAALPGATPVAAAAGGGQNENGLACQVLVASGNADYWMALGTSLSVVGGILGSQAGIWKAIGLQGLSKLNGGFALGLKVNITQDVKNARSAGKILAALSTLLEAAGTVLAGTTTDCRTRLNQQLMLCFLAAKNPHDNRKKATFDDCLDDVESGQFRFGF